MYRKNSTKLQLPPLSIQQKSEKLISHSPSSEHQNNLSELFK